MFGMKKAAKLPLFFYLFWGRVKAYRLLQILNLELSLTFMWLIKNKN